MNHLTLMAAACVTLVSAPPILPFTEISDAKIDTLCKHMVEADEITPQDCNVVLQLDHIRWKYEQMREILYKTAKNADDGATINAKDLGKIFDTIDRKLDEERERTLQESKKRLEEAEKKPRVNEV
jgi:hypothetical protein